MHLKFSDLKLTIHSMIQESASNANIVSLSDGSIAERYSTGHIKDLQTLSAALTNVTKQFKYGSANRAAFSDAARRIRIELSKGLRHAETLELKKDDDDELVEDVSGFDRDAESYPVEPGEDL